MFKAFRCIMHTMQKTTSWIKITLTLVLVVNLLSGCRSNESNDPLLTNTAWKRVQKSFKLEHHVRSPQVAQQIQWFQAHPKTLERMLNNAGPYLYYVQQQVDQKKLPGEVTLLPIVESAYNPFAYSRAGAAGMWQLMPTTASQYGVKQNWWYDGRRDVHVSTEAALRHLDDLSRTFNGDWEHAFAAYNAGAGRLKGAIYNNSHNGYSTKFWSLPLPRETQTYVPRLLALAELITHPSRYHIQLPAIKDRPYVDVVNVGAPVDLPHAAKLAHMSLHELYQLNPGYNRWKPAPNGATYHLMLPIEKVEQFKLNMQHGLGKNLSNPDDFNQAEISQNLLDRSTDTPHQPFNTVISPPYSSSTITSSSSSEESLPLLHKHPTVTYIAKPGDTVATVAKLYSVKSTELASWNDLARDEPLAIGQKLILWTANKPIETIKFSKYRKSGKTKFGTYLIKKGDTLFSIAKRHKTNVQTLQRINSLKATHLKPGMKLRVS